jgi:hypothetical protein
MVLNISIRLEGDLNFIAKEIEEIQRRIAEQVPIEARRIIDESTPSGKTYRRKAITTRRTKAKERIGLQKRGKTRLISGYGFHRASAKGQAPAKDTGKLYRNIKVLRRSATEYRVVFGAPYAGYLEFNLDRPFILPAIEAAVTKVLNQ